MKKQRSAAEGKANEELSASPIKNYSVDHEICRRPTDQREVISRMYIMSQIKRFVRFVRFVFEKNIRVY